MPRVYNMLIYHELKLLMFYVIECLLTCLVNHTLARPSPFVHDICAHVHVRMSHWMHTNIDVK